MTTNVSIGSWVRNSTQADCDITVNSDYTPITNGIIFNTSATENKTYCVAASDLVDLRCCSEFKVTIEAINAVSSLDSFKVYLYENTPGWTKIIDYSMSGYSGEVTLSGTISSSYQDDSVFILMQYVKGNASATRGLTASNAYVVASYVAPTAGFTTSPTTPKGTVPLSVTFTDTSTTGCPSVNDYLWEFGDGDTDSTSTPGTHQYTTGGEYTARQTVSNSGGSDTEEITVYAWEAVSNVDIIGPEIVELNKINWYKASNDGYGESYLVTWGNTGSGSYDTYNGPTDFIRGYKFYSLTEPFTVDCYVGAKDDTGSFVGVQKKGTINVSIPDPPMSKRMRDNFSMLVNGVPMEIK